MKECEVCGKFEEVMDAIIDARPTEACKQCVDLHNAILLEKPSTKKISDVERLFTVRERLEEAAQIKEKERLKRIAEVEKKTAFPETLSYKLKKAREKAGLSKERLSDDLGLSVEELNKIEAGENPSEKALKRYEQFFKMKFVEKGESTEGEQGALDFKDSKITLKGLVEKAKTFFSAGKAVEESEDEIRIDEDSKEEE